MDYKFTRTYCSPDFVESFAGSILASFDHAKEPRKETKTKEPHWRSFLIFLLDFQQTTLSLKEPRNTGGTPQRWTMVEISAQGDLVTGLWKPRCLERALREPFGLPQPSGQISSQRHSTCSSLSFTTSNPPRTTTPPMSPKTTFAGQ